MKEKRKINTNKPTFDLKTHVRDSKGQIARENHYRLTIKNGKMEFERPPGSGFIYDASGTLIRSPKGVKDNVETPKQEFKDADLLAQVEKLQKQIIELKAQKEADKSADNEQEEVHMTAEDVEVEDVVTAPASEADNSEEIKLMEQAGATVEAQKVKQNSKQPMFKR